MSDYRYWLALDRVKGVGLATLAEIHRSLAELSLSAGDLFACTDNEIRNEFHFNNHILSSISQAREFVDSASDEYQKILEAGIIVTFFFEKSYPAKLTEKLHNNAPAVFLLNRKHFASIRTVRSDFRSF